MKTQIIEIQQQANALLHKRSHVRQAARKLLYAVNSELSQVESFHAKSLYFDIDSYDVTQDSMYQEEMQYRLRLSFDDDAKIELIWRSKAGFDEETTNWKTTDFETTRMKTIRIFAANFVDALQYFETELIRQNVELADTVALLDDMIQKLSA